MGCAVEVSCTRQSSAPELFPCSVFQAVFSEVCCNDGMVGSANNHLSTVGYSITNLPSAVLLCSGTCTCLYVSPAFALRTLPLRHCCMVIKLALLTVVCQRTVNQLHYYNSCIPPDARLACSLGGGRIAAHCHFHILLFPHTQAHGFTNAS